MNQDLNMKTTFTKKTQYLSNTLKLLSVGAFVLVAMSATAQTTFNYTGSLQTYTVPVGVTSIHVDAQGAQGGSITIACPATGGLGARMQGDVTVTPGEVITILVGGQGQSNGEDAGGGGGSFVVRTGNVPLVVAGGGGGASNNIQICTGLRNGVNASITTSGTASANGLVAGGTAGNGGGANVGSGCGGGGFLTDGGYGANMNGRGRAFINGGAGGTGSVSNDHGGYGGGGCGWFYGGNGGGGGGYSGGGTDGNYPSTYFGGGGGGGSYNIGTNQINTAGYKTGDGLVVITVINALSATITQVAAISCFGQSTASLTATPVGGTGPFTYAWAPSGGNAATASGLGSGTYTVTITDNVGSTATQTFTITQPTAITAAPMQTNISCNGGSNGSAMVMISGGTPGYSYSWSPTGGNASSASNLTAGTYTCTVTDANSCTTTQSFNLTAPSAVVVTASAQPILCNGGGTTVNVSGSGGVSPYTGTGTFTAAAGTFTYSVTDANGCSSTTSVNITEPSAIVTSVLQNNVTCNGGTDGSIDLTVTGGTAPYTFDWNNGTYTTEDISGLSPGQYAGAITDANGCSVNQTVTITEPSALVATLSIANDTACSADGAFTLAGESPAGGVFSGAGVSAGAFDPSVAGAGVHVITYIYTDSSGCTASATDSIYVDVCTGTQISALAAQVSIFPNPNNGTFNLQVASASDVTIYDAQGKLVYAQKVQPNMQNTLNLSENGVYMITVINANGERTSQRVMVTK